MGTKLKSFVGGAWQEGTGRGTVLVNPSTEEPLAEASTEGLDLGSAVTFARSVGSSALRPMTFARRGEVLRAMAKALTDAREELIGLGVANAGNTRSDAKFDIDGAAATLMSYAELGAQLGERSFLLDGEGVALGRSARLYGQHVGVPKTGVAVHVNAFNFPAWGMAEKLAVSMLAGVPAITKPATATALMAHRIVELWVAQGAFPAGAVSLICGAAGDLLTHLGGQDVVAFTGSSETAAGLRRLDNLVAGNVRLNVEAGSLNAAVLGPDVQSGSETMGMFLNEVAREVTQKSGQKCTAIRRIYVPGPLLDEVRAQFVERFAQVRVGNPSDERTSMGPLATKSQLADVRAGIAQLAQGAQVACGGPEAVEGLGAPSGKGYFVAPTLIVRSSPKPADVVNRLEVFGPIVTLMPYGSEAEVVQQVAGGGGGLVAAVYSDDRAFLSHVLLGIAPFHGRVTIGSEKLAGQSVAPGTVLPQLVHGGPGRAGGGEELGGLRGLSLYLQRVAVQGHRGLIEQLVALPKT